MGGAANLIGSAPHFVNKGVSRYPLA